MKYIRLLGEYLSWKCLDYWREIFYLFLPHVFSYFDTKDFGICFSSLYVSGDEDMHCPIMPACTTSVEGVILTRDNAAPPLRLSGRKAWYGEKYRQKVPIDHEQRHYRSSKLQGVL